MALRLSVTDAGCSRVPLVAGWELIVSQMDAVSNLFDTGTRTTFSENENDSTANPFMKVGSMIWAEYAIGGKYEFLLQFTGAGAGVQTLHWTQTSILSSSDITGFQLIYGDVGLDLTDAQFYGLGASSSGNCVIDGDGSAFSDWWHCAGVVGCLGPTRCVPASNRLTADSVQLWIKKGPNVHSPNVRTECAAFVLNASTPSPHSVVACHALPLLPTPRPTS